MNSEQAARLGAKARTARDRTGLTRTQVAEKVGVSIDVISRLERGAIQTDIDRLIAIADALGVSLDWLLGREEFRRGARESQLERDSRAFRAGWVACRVAMNRATEKAGPA